MNDENPGAGQIPVRMIGQHRKRIQEYRRRIQRLHADREVSGRMHDDFAVEVIGYYDVLREFRGADAIADGDLPDITPLRSRLGKTTRVIQSGPMGFGDSYQEVPAVREVSLERLVQLSHQLDDAAQKLGFGAKAVQTTPPERDGSGF